VGDGAVWSGEAILGLVIMVVLGTTVLVGTTLGGRYQVAPPVLLLCLGGVIALLPGLTDIELEPEVVLLLFLPAILYWESINTSLVRAACGPGPLVVQALAF